MKLFSYTSLAFALVSGAVGSGLIILIRKCFPKKKNDEKKKTRITTITTTTTTSSKTTTIDCLLFSPHDIHYSRTTFPCDRLACPLCSYNKLCTVLKAARFQLDVCMYLITEVELTNIIVALYKKGVKIRVITDRQMSEEAYKSKSGLLAKFRIPTRFLESKGMMHNKFFIIDRKIVVTGSCNWTQNGFMSNYENMVVIQNDEVAIKFNRYFNEIWSHEKVK